MLGLLASLAVLTSVQGNPLDAPELKGAVVAAYVQELNGPVRFEQNSRLLMTPASNQKVLTAIYALHRLGPDFRPRTRFWREGDGLLVDAPGDPALSRETLLQIRNSLGACRDVRVKQGYRIGVPDTWEFDDLPNRYAPRIAAFSVDRAGFELWADAKGVRLEPAAYGVKIRYQREPGPLKARYDPFARMVHVRGTLPATHSRIDTYAVPEPDQAAASILGGRLRELAAVPQRPPDAEWLGSSLKDVLKDAFARSDNFVHEHLLLLAAANEGPLGESAHQTARERLARFLQNELGLGPTEVRPFDGSGMSRHNLVTAEALAKAHGWARAQAWWPALAQAYPVPGKGTLEKRLAGMTVQAKTGTLSLVNTLSGWVTDAQGKELVFAVMVNQCPAPSAKVRELIDDFLRQVILLGVNGTDSAYHGTHGYALPIKSGFCSHLRWLHRPGDDGLAAFLWPHR